MANTPDLAWPLAGQAFSYPSHPDLRLPPQGEPNWNPSNNMDLSAMNPHFPSTPPIPIQNQSYEDSSAHGRPTMISMPMEDPRHNNHHDLHLAGSQSWNSAIPTLHAPTQHHPHQLASQAYPSPSPYPHPFSHLSQGQMNQLRQLHSQGNQMLATSMGHTHFGSPMAPSDHQMHMLLQHMNMAQQAAHPAHTPSRPGQPSRNGTPSPGLLQSSPSVPHQPPQYNSYFPPPPQQDFAPLQQVPQVRPQPNNKTGASPHLVSELNGTVPSTASAPAKLGKETSNGHSHPSSLAGIPQTNSSNNHQQQMQQESVPLPSMVPSSPLVQSSSETSTLDALDLDARNLGGWVHQANTYQDLSLANQYAHDHITSFNHQQQEEVQRSFLLQQQQQQPQQQPQHHRQLMALQDFQLRLPQRFNTQPSFSTHHPTHPRPRLERSASAMSIMRAQPQPPPHPEPFLSPRPYANEDRHSEPDMGRARDLVEMQGDWEVDLFEDLKVKSEHLDEPQAVHPQAHPVLG
ncbi:hypothetical protein BS47DRAFT_328667 [Hydnum rufescens UP504]|uniref:Uncharacterized protein n=1 Tax=Hydnum rufescens UP504 TaxID=1448309 RepID=A0A9P6DX85_9AGAM|nr:hypothetical protein BS47DRAFT_328667 [Hydnum rufescens UP504]